jgi:hypothetical protein
MKGKFKQNARTYIHVVYQQPNAAPTARLDNKGLLLVLTSLERQAQAY